MSANILFISELTLKSRTGISEAIDGTRIKPQIKLAQDMYVQTALGSRLYQRLQTGIDAGNLTTDETTLLNNYVTDCLVWYTMSLLPMSLGYQIFSKGVLQKTAEESETPSRSDLEAISGSYKQTAEFYKQRLIDYLRENYTAFAEYNNPGSGWDVIFPETKAYTCPIYLGDAYSEQANRSYSGNNVTSVGSGNIEVTPSVGATSFTVTTLPSGASIISAIRSGLGKGITTVATANTAYLQINGNIVTLPTGDQVADSGDGTGELFILTYR